MTWPLLTSAKPPMVLEGVYSAPVTTGLKKERRIFQLSLPDVHQYRLYLVFNTIQQKKKKNQFCFEILCKTSGSTPANCPLERKFLVTVEIQTGCSCNTFSFRKQLSGPTGPPWTFYRGPPRAHSCGIFEWSGSFQKLSNHCRPCGKQFVHALSTGPRLNGQRGRGGEKTESEGTCGRGGGWGLGAGGGGVHRVVVLQ